MAQKTTSIKKSLLRSYIIIILITFVPMLYAIIVARLHSTWYNKVITNVSEASQLCQLVKQDIPNEIWNIVAGQKHFTEGEQYILLRRIRNGINKMQESATAEAEKLLDVATRTESTLRYYIDMLECQIQANASVAENEALMEDIRSIASLLNDILQEFIVAEIETASASNIKIKHSFFFLTSLQVLIGLIILAIAFYTFSTVLKRTGNSIERLSELSSRIASGDLQARVHKPQVEELCPLAENLNTMANRLQNLIDENIREQQNLQKAEMKTLQAQITPHFLYNTFDSIIWLAESGQTEDVVSITKAFSQFFRISLSRGHEWITVSQELDHVKSYLTIQKIRYANILDYNIEADEEIGEVPVLKLLLQPLVENAIYHGIKKKRGRGKIFIRARLNPEGEKIIFSVEDNGIGFTEERLTQVREEITKGKSPESLQAAYGLYNVNKRLQLYYEGQAKLEIESQTGKGTVITCIIPVQLKEGENHV